MCGTVLVLPLCVLSGEKPGRLVAVPALGHSPTNAVREEATT